MDKRVLFVEQFLTHEKESVRKWAKQILEDLNVDIERARKREEAKDKDRYESFE